MSDIDILSEMLQASARIPLDVQHGKKQVTLVDSQCPQSSVTVHGLPDSTIVIKADAFKCLEGFLSGSHGECKRADFLVVADALSKKRILCIEMKKTKGREKDVIEQLKGAQCLAWYCQKIGIEFWKSEGFLSGFEYRFISIGRTSIPKRQTRIVRQHRTHDRADKMMKIDWAKRLQFNHLAGS